MYERREYEGFEIGDIIRIIKKHIILLIAVMILSSATGFLLSIYCITSVYQASTTIIVRQNKIDGEEISKTDVDLSKSLIYTYAEMAKSNTVLRNTGKLLKLDKLDKKLIAVSPVKDTQILKIEVMNSNPESAMDIANTLVQEFKHEIIRITGTDNVAVVDYAILPEKPIKPDKIMNSFIALMLGLSVTLLIIFIREYFDNTIKSENDIKKYLKLSIVGTVPNFSLGGKVGYEYGKVYGESSSELNDN